MQIPVNKDLDAYKDDFFKGLTFRQTFFAGLTLVSGLTVFSLFYFGLSLNTDLSVLLAMPFSAPFALYGFLRIRGMNPLEYVQRRKFLEDHQVFYLEPEFLEEALMGEKEDLSGVRRSESEGKTDSLPGRETGGLRAREGAGAGSSLCASAKDGLQADFQNEPGERTQSMFRKETEREGRA